MGAWTCTSPWQEGATPSSPRDGVRGSLVEWSQASPMVGNNELSTLPPPTPELSMESYRELNCHLCPAVIRSPTPVVVNESWVGNMKLLLSSGKWGSALTFHAGARPEKSVTESSIQSKVSSRNMKISRLYLKITHHTKNQSEKVRSGMGKRQHQYHRYDRINWQSL